VAQVVGAGAGACTAGVGASKIISAFGYTTTGKYTFTLRNKGTFVGAKFTVNGTGATVGLVDAIFGDCSYDSSTGVLTVWTYNLAATPALADVAANDTALLEVFFVDSDNGS
jgi:hypothetical protein